MARADDDPTADWYRRAARELAPHSGLHAGWAARWAEDDELLDLVDALPRAQRQPSLVFTALDAAGLPVDADWPALRGLVLERWPEIAALAEVARTQTNEVGRCAPLLLALQRIPGPIALVELGAAAGLCLALDRYSYHFRRDGDGQHGDGEPVGSEVRLGGGAPILDCVVAGRGPLPDRMPEIVWRRGVDLAPLDVRDPGDRRRLATMIPPDRPDRRARLEEALAAVQADPPQVVAGEALESLSELAAAAPTGVTVVVVSLGTAVYFPPAARAALLGRIREVGARSVTLEAESALPSVAERVGSRTARDPWPFLLAVDGEPIARCAPHGDRVSYLGS